MDIPAVKRLLCLLDAVKNADYIESRAEAERGFVDGFYDAVRECHSRLCEECPTRLLHLQHLPGAFDGYVRRARPSYAPEPDYDQLAEIARMDAEEATEAQRLAREEGL